MTIYLKLDPEEKLPRCSTICNIIAKAIEEQVPEYEVVNVDHINLVIAIKCTKTIAFPPNKQGVSNAPTN